MTTGGLQGFTPTEETRRAMRVRQTFDKTCAGIRADSNMSELGKQRAMAAAWLKCRAALVEIRATETDAVVARRAELEGQLFGIGSTNPMAAADYRDAQDRAEQCAQPKDALRLLDRTTRTHDETLAKAIAGFAVEQGWSGVLDVYASTRPAVQDALAELTAIDAMTSDSTQQLGRGAIYNPTTPRELSHLTSGMIAQLAAQNDDAGATAGITGRAS
jgi:hypothetical protein